MAKGSGLSIDSSSSSSDRIRYAFDQNQTSQTPALIINSLLYQHHHHPQLKMESKSHGQELSTIQFTVAPHDHDHDGDEAPGPSDRRQRRVIDEMDFFAASNNSIKDDRSSDVGTSADKEERVIEVNTGLHLLTANAGSDQSTVDDGISHNSEGKKSAKSPELGTLQAEVERINRENQQLRDILNQVTTNYNALQMHLITLMQQQQQQQKHNDDSEAERDNKEEDHDNEGIARSGEKGPTVPRKFMDLGLAESCKDPNTLSNSSGGRTLGRRSRSPPNDNNEGEGGLLNKATRLFESSSKANGNTSVDHAAEATMRKARVSVRARSEAPMISDGCQWRKYGQKMAKGNPCPRAYYRCTMAGGCPVRKQVQRCAEDRTILITTYEGTHSHPLPPAAMMMASATSSAARMLLSGSMPSPDGTGLINPPNFLAYSRSLFPCSSSSVATISASAPFPTVTLDLTQTPNSTTSNNPLQQLFQRPAQPSHFPVPFSTPPTLLYNQSRFSGLQVSGQDNSNNNDNNRNNTNTNNNNNNQFADTVTALTTDPNFTAALAAAITSLIGNGGANNTASATSDSNGNNTNSHENISNGS